MKFIYECKYNPKKPWRVIVRYHGHNYSLGYFSNKEEAIKCRNTKLDQLLNRDPKWNTKFKVQLFSTMRGISNLKQLIEHLEKKDQRLLESIFKDLMYLFNNY